MKSIKYIFLFITFTLFVSCNEKSKEETAKVEYQCPMKCEDEKVY